MILEKYLENLDKKKFSSKTFSEFREELLDHANLYYKDNILDFSEASLGGLILDFAAIVGESLVYYAEQQFKELDYETAVDFDSIIKHLKKSNIKVPKSSPSVATISFYIRVEKDSLSKVNDLMPDSELLPVIKSGTVMQSGSIEFILQEDVDFSSDYVVERTEEISGTKYLILKKNGIAISGFTKTETFFISNNSEFYPSVSLEENNITNIISVVDENNNEYYEVDYLTQTTVFKKGKAKNSDIIQFLPAPYRFVIEENYIDNITNLRFGNGSGFSTRDNVFYSPEDLMLPIKNKETFGRMHLDPSLLLVSNTLGISPKNKNITITYNHGGGSSHNVAEGTISVFKDFPIVVFPNSTVSTSQEKTQSVVDSITITNPERSLGGEEAPSIEDLKKLIPMSTKSQSRIINTEDLLSRIMTMPSNFGRVNKIIALDNQYSLPYKDLYVVCKNEEGFYTEASDVLKVNLSNYINEYRLIGTNFNILDVGIYNFGLKIKINIKENFDPELTKINAIDSIVKNCKFYLMDIGDPINVNRIISTLENKEVNPGVESVATDRKNIVVSKNNLDSFYDIDLDKNIDYQQNSFNPHTSYSDGFVYPPRGSIFELKYNFADIVVIA